MSPSNCWKDFLWLIWFLIQIPVIVLIDGLEFWPRRLYLPASSPLHFAYQIKQDYVRTYNDPLVQWTAETGTNSWVPLFFAAEVFLALPAVIYGVYRLGLRRAGTCAADELLFLVYAFEVAFTTFVCIHDVFYWDDAVYPPELKKTFIVYLYGPWFIIHMCYRIVSRAHAADAILNDRKRR